MGVFTVQRHSSLSSRNIKRVIWHARWLVTYLSGAPTWWHALYLSLWILELAKWRADFLAFHNRSPLTALSICFLLDLASSVIPGPEAGSPSGPTLKDSISEWVLIAAGISESDTQATIWQTAMWFAMPAANTHGSGDQVGPAHWPACHMASHPEQRSESVGIKSSHSYPIW